MFKKTVMVLVLCFLVFSVSAFSRADEKDFFQKEHKAVIVDLDFCEDVDDVMAVRVATTLDRAGQIELKGMMLCVTGENNVEALHGLLCYDGYASLPIGTSAAGDPCTSPYWDVLAEYHDPGSLHKEDAVTLYRKLLSDSKTRITIITTGYLGNIAALMKSGPDEISELSGMELLKEKCDAVYITGGAYPGGYDNNFFFTESARTSAAYVFSNAQIPLVFQTSNNGGPVLCGGLLQQTDRERRDPAAKALDAFGTSDGRAAWDPMTVWAAAYPPEETRFSVLKADILFNEETGFNAYEEKEDGAFFLLERSDDDPDWYREQLDLLTVYGSRDNS